MAGSSRTATSDSPSDDQKTSEPKDKHKHASTPQADPSCIFCLIASTFTPVSPLSPPSQLENVLDPDKLSPPAFVLASTEHAVAFLDIAPLTRGHVLLVPRGHWTKVGDLPTSMGSELGRLLPILARSVMSAVLPDIPASEADYNVVQNNGAGAAQVIPHVHFHIIPRPPLDYTYRPPEQSGTNGNPRTKYAPSKLPTGIQASYIQFGRGMRNELDEDDAALLVKQIRQAIAEEWTREHGAASKGKL